MQPFFDFSYPELGFVAVVHVKFFRVSLCRSQKKSDQLVAFFI